MSCSNTGENYYATAERQILDSTQIVTTSNTGYIAELTELQRCDILVRPNHNWCAGTTPVEGGTGFGHCVLVIEGATAQCTDSLLSKAVIFESHSRDVPEPYQLRKIKALVNNIDKKYSNSSFSSIHKGYRYRLRMELTEGQKDSIIAFVKNQDNDVSSWRASKAFNNYDTDTSNFEQYDKHYWYCSLLVWQAFYNVLGVDIDANKNFAVYPNDIINSPYFNDDGRMKQKRVRF